MREKGKLVRKYVLKTLTVSEMTENIFETQCLQRFPKQNCKLYQKKLFGTWQFGKIDVLVNIII